MLLRRFARFVADYWRLMCGRPMLGADTLSKRTVYLTPPTDDEERYLRQLIDVANAPYDKNTVLGGPRRFPSSP